MNTDIQTVTTPITNTRTSTRLASLGLAVAMTMGTLLGVNTLAGVEAGAAQMAQTTPSTQG